MSLGDMFVMSHLHRFIVTDLNSNPARFLHSPTFALQAEDRAHRIGQLRDVRVYKLVAAGTVDEDIHAMGERKRELTEGILASSKSGEKGGKKEDKDRDRDKDDDINTIGKILQGALQRRTNK